MYVILSFFGVLYILELINRYGYRILPRLTIDNGNFFDRKLEVREVSSLKDYIATKIEIYKKMQEISNIKEEDISEYDAGALQELKQYLNDLKQYLKNIMLDQSSRIGKVDSHIQYTLNYGKLDIFFLSCSISCVDSITVRFQSFSSDMPVLEISNYENSAIFTYRIKSKHFRFINPDIKVIADIKEIIDRMAVKGNIQLKAA